MNKNTFIGDAQKVHGNKYDYSKVEYKNSNIKVCIICPEHGEFWKTPGNHVYNRQGCPICKNIKDENERVEKEKDFIEKAKEIHGNKYDYSKIKYVNIHTKVRIYCNKCKKYFEQTPSIHVWQKCGCPYCDGKKKTLEEKINEARAVHGDKYDYSKAKHVKCNVKNIIICNNCGKEFEATWHSHIIAKHNCPYCSHRSYKYTTEEWVEKVRNIHGNKYDYSKANYINNRTSVCIICPEHGEFWQTPTKHLAGQGCPKCYGNIRKTTEEFIEEAKKIHGDKYDYSKVEYINNHTKVCIICPEHGEFWQSPDKHLAGQGCPVCKESIMESEIEVLLQKNNINFCRKCRKSILPWIGTLELDFYLPDYNAVIECHGIQHFEPVKYFGGEEKYLYTVENDTRKKELCEANGMRVFYYSTVKKAPKNYMGFIYKNKEKLLNSIKKYGNNR